MAHSSTERRAVDDTDGGCTSSVSILRLSPYCTDIGVGECGPGKAVTFDPEQFVMHRLRQLERTGRLDMPDGWWDWDP